MKALGWTALLLGGWLGGAHAQAPELMLLIDGSRQMSDPIGPEPVRCAPAGTVRPAAGIAYQPDTALNLLKEALVGTVRAPRWCITETAAERAAHRLGADGAAPHHRAMCCHDDACATFGPCGEDHDSGAVEAAAAQIDRSWARDGLLTRFGDQLKFSLLFTDGHRGAAEGAAGHYSYGPVRAGENLGARGPGDHPGALITAHRGIEGDGNAPIGEEPGALRAHARFVAHAVRRLVPFGEAPLAALIDDARIAAAGPDDARACRQRAAVLVTRGVPMASPYGPAADAAARFHAETGMRLYVVVLDPLEDGPAHRWGQAVAAAGAPDAARGVWRVATGATLRGALAEIAAELARPSLAVSRPLITSPAPADVCPAANLACQRPPDAVVQWRISASAQDDAGDVVGRLHGEALRCQGGPTPAPAEQIDFGAVLAARVGTPRRTQWQRDGALAVLSGGVGACFDAVGRATCPLPVIDGPLAIEGAPPADRRAGLVTDPRPRRRSGLLINGHFGAAGLGPAGRRRLGAFGAGELVALRPPSLELASPAYRAWRARMDARPTLVIGGAMDGLLHVFRARDGVEVLSVAPDATLPALQTGQADAQGALDVAEMIPCRTVDGGGAADCPQAPAAWTFATVLAGTTGQSVFGLDGSALDRLAASPDQALDPVNGFGLSGGWTVDARSLGGAAPSTLGEAVSRPLLVHLRDRAAGEGRIRARVVVGCGAATPADPGAGRCVLVLDALTGAVVRRFDVRDHPALVAPMSGSAAAYPLGNVAAAERLYLGDAAGRLWRIDVRADDPAAWRIDIAWPPSDADAARGYVIGRPVIGRPSLALRPDGRLAVGFATGGDGPAPAAWVSFNDAAALAGGGVGFEVSANWVMPLAAREVALDGPTVRDGIAFLTTETRGAGPCGADGQLGRLYGVDYVRRYTDADGAAAQFDFEGRALDVRPALPRFDRGARVESALAVVLPPGRVAAGLALARTPGCGDAPGHDAVILALAGAGAPIEAGDASRALQLEVVDGGRVERRAVDAGLVARHRAGQLDLCLSCVPGDPTAAVAPDPDRLPFPSRLIYWGSTLLD